MSEGQVRERGMEEVTWGRGVGAGHRQSGRNRKKDELQTVRSKETGKRKETEGEKLEK